MVVVRGLQRRQFSAWAVASALAGPLASEASITPQKVSIALAAKGSLFHLPLVLADQLGFFKQECFLILDGEGLRYSFTVIQRPRILKWEQVDKVNYQLYEINFKLKETGEIISMQTGYLENEAEISDLKAYIETQCQMM